MKIKSYIIVDILGSRHGVVKSVSRESAQNIYIGGFRALIDGVFAITESQYELITKGCKNPY
tara:strand:- start:377 stop:562 length:186 start_codon:yes stop_codon:yes gene_type:complete